MEEEKEDIREAEVFKTDMDINVKYENDMPRINILRLFWYFPQYFIIVVWSILAYFVGAFYILHILFVGERHEWSWNFIVKFTRHTIKWSSYIFLMTDKRPQIIVD